VAAKGNIRRRRGGFGAGSSPAPAAAATYSPLWLDYTGAIVESSATARVVGGAIIASSEFETDFLWSVLYAGAGAGDTVVVGAGVSVTMDVASTDVYACVEVYGTVIVDETQNTQLNTDCMEIFSGGIYRAGTTASPFPRTVTHTIELSGARADDPQLAAPAGPAIASSNRGIMVEDGGELSLVAAVPAVTIFKLGADAAALASSLTADQAVTLKAGDVLELSTTKYYSEGLTDGQLNSPVAFYPGGIRRPGFGREMVTVASDVTASTTIPISATNWPSESGATISYTSQATLKYAHHGRLQYVVAPVNEAQTGTSLSYTNTAIASGDDFGSVQGVAITGATVLAAIAAGAETVIDNRATLGLITHPIKVQAPTGGDWDASGYGAHLMTMGNTSKTMLQGVQFTRVGQAGFLGRYPIHDHMRSYASFTGTVTVPASGTYSDDIDSTYNYVKNCSIHQASNRAVVIHGTCGGNYYQNVCADIDTHAIFLEDGSEERNIIDGNFVSGVGAIRFGLGSEATFTAAITATTNLLTVSAIATGALAVGQQLSVLGTHVGTILAQMTGAAGSTGTYALSFAQAGSVASSANFVASRAIKAHDIPAYQPLGTAGAVAGGAAGIWYTNPENYLRNNIVAGHIHGIWNAFSHPYYTGYQERGVRTGGGVIAFTSRPQDPTLATNVGDGTPAAMQAETITLTCTSAGPPAVFSRSGSLTGAMSAVTVGTAASHGSNGTPGGYSYILQAAGAAFQVGDTFVFDVKRFLGVFGASRDVVLTSGTTAAYGPAPGWNDQALQYLDNESSSGAHDNALSQPFVIDEEGRTVGPTLHYAIGQRVPFGTSTAETRFLIEGMNLWKGTYCQYQNESDHVHYLNWRVSGQRLRTSAGGVSEMIQGNVNSTSAGGRPAQFDGCLFAPKTLDDYYASWGGGGVHHRTNIMVSYGGGINRVNCILIPSKATTLVKDSGESVRPLLVENGGTMRLWDFYLYPINQHFVGDTNNAIIGEDPGYLGIRSPPIHMLADNFPATELTASYTGIVDTLARTPWAQGNSGAFKLPTDGTLFKQSGGWWTHNRPFLTYGTSGGVDAQSGVNFTGYNGKLVSSSYTYLGVQFLTANGASVLSGANSDAIDYTRLEADGVTPVTNGDWNFGYGDTTPAYGQMKHAAVLSMATGGTPVKVVWPNGVTDVSPYPPTSVTFSLQGFATTDHIAIGFDFDDASVGTVSMTNGVTTVTPIAVASPNSRAGMLASTTDCYWIDTGNDVVWVHIWGTNMTNRYSSDTYYTDRKWLNTYVVTVA
jgi:hypothetical protein